MLPSDQGTGWKCLGDGVSTSSGEAVVVDSLGRDGCYWELTGGDGHSEWDGSKPSTVEFRMRVRPEDLKTPNGAEMVISDGEKYYFIELNNTDYKTYRMVLEHGRAAVFEDGVLLRELAGQAPSGTEPTNMIRFGDSSGGIEAVSEWQSVKWTNGAAVYPGGN